MGNRSEWQNKVEGVWHGLPGIFDPDGTHRGVIKVSRHVEIDQKNNPIFHVSNQLESSSDLAKLLSRCPDLQLSVADDGNSRVYVGRDIYGAGHPFGTTLLGNDYIHPWNIDTGVIVQLLPDGVTQLYSCLAYQGPTIIGAIFGRYRNVPKATPEALADLEQFFVAERTQSDMDVASIHSADIKWRGQLAVFDNQHQSLGMADVSVVQKSTGENSAEVTTDIQGPITRHTKTLRRWEGKRCFYDGPDTFGNGIAYGRALFATQHLFGKANKIHSREVIIDEGLAVVWPVYQGGNLAFVLHGLLSKE